MEPVEEAKPVEDVKSQKVLPEADRARLIQFFNDPRVAHSSNKALVKYACDKMGYDVEVVSALVCNERKGPVERSVTKRGVAAKPAAAAKRRPTLSSENRKRIQKLLANPDIKETDEQLVDFLNSVDVAVNLEQIRDMREAMTAKAAPAKEDFQERTVHVDHVHHDEVALSDHRLTMTQRFKIQ